MALKYGDRSKSYTAQDLIRKYNLDSLTKDREAIKTLNNGLTKVNAIIEDYVKNVSKYVNNQVDGFNTTWFFNGIPTLDNRPFIDFSEEEKNFRIDDLYYDRDTGYIYQLKKTEDVFFWELIEDEALKNSLAIANSSADTGDNKRNLFYEKPTPPYDAGDIWYDAGIIKRCRCSRTEEEFKEGEWVLQNDYSDESVLLETRAVLDTFIAEVRADYVTNSALEITVNGINANVSSNTTKIEKLSNETTNITENLKSAQLQINDNTVSITTVNQTLINDYLNESQTNELIQNAKTGVTNTFIQSGGDNLLRNTAPFIVENDIAEYWNGRVRQLNEDESVSGHALGLLNNVCSQTVSTPNGTYSLSFKWKKLLNASEASISYNGKSIKLEGESGTVHTSDEITTGFLTFNMTCNTDLGHEIYDLILKHGNEGETGAIQWKQNANEMQSDTITIGEGITAISNTTNTKSTMGSDGFKVKNKVTGVSVMETTDTGGLFQDLVSKGNSNISGLIIQKRSSQIWISGEV